MCGIDLLPDDSSFHETGQHANHGHHIGDEIVGVILGAGRRGGVVGAPGRQHDSGAGLASPAGVRASDAGLGATTTRVALVAAANATEARLGCGNLRSLLAGLHDLNRPHYLPRSPDWL